MNLRLTNTTVRHPAARASAAPALHGLDLTVAQGRAGGGHRAVGRGQDHAAAPAGVCPAARRWTPAARWQRSLGPAPRRTAAPARPSVSCAPGAAAAAPAARGDGRAGGAPAARGVCGPACAAWSIPPTSRWPSVHWPGSMWPTSCSTAWTGSRAASASGWAWPGHWLRRPACSWWTNRCPHWIRRGRSRPWPRSRRPPTSAVPRWSPRCTTWTWPCSIFPRVIGLRGGALAFDLPSAQVTPEHLHQLYAQHLDELAETAPPAPELPMAAPPVPMQCR